MAPLSPPPMVGTESQLSAHNECCIALFVVACVRGYNYTVTVFSSIKLMVFLSTVCYIMVPTTILNFTTVAVLAFHSNYRL